MTETIAIVPFRPALAPAFTELNRAWIERLFRLEESDWKVLRDPASAIIAPGGQIFFAMDGADAVGTVAAVRVNASSYELAKMAVRPSHQGHGIGERLGQAVIEFAKAAGAKKVYLETNSSLGGAIRLYERLGFVQMQPPTPSDYARADVYMEVLLR